MATQTGSTYISESLIDIVEIPTAKLGLSTTARSTKVFPGDYINDRQPEIADETGNTCITETITDSIEILMANLGFMTMASWKKV